jgi:hypothetical protein
MSLSDRWITDEWTTAYAAGDMAARAGPALTRLIRAMFPHPAFPDGPYERCAATILEAAEEDVRLYTQLDQGLRDLDAVGGAPFADLDPEAQLALLRRISDTEFFEGVRSRVITSLYDDREVWELLGYEGPSFAQGGYLHRGFDDLDWLPEPRIEELS